MVAIFEERSCVALYEELPVLAALGIIVGLRSSLSSVHELVSRSRPKTLSILAVEPWLDLTLRIGQLVILIALNTCTDSVIGRLWHSCFINGFLLLAHLLRNLILCLYCALFCKLLHSQINKLVVSLGLLLVVSELRKSSFYKVFCLWIGLCLENRLESITVTCKGCSTCYEHHCHHH